MRTVLSNPRIIDVAACDVKVGDWLVFDAMAWLVTARSTSPSTVALTLGGTGGVIRYHLRRNVEVIR